MVRGNSTAITVRRAAAIAIAGAAATALSACGAGQVTQTDTKQTAIAGVNIDKGDLALRDLQIEFGSAEGYAPGDDAALRVWIANEGPDEVSLVGVDLLDEHGEVVEDGGTVTLVSADAAEAAPSESADEASETPVGDESGTPADEASASPAEDPFDGATTFEVPIAPAGHVRLDQAVEGGDYLLLENLSEELASGESLTVRFNFSDDTQIPVDLPVGQNLDEVERSYFEPEEAAEGH